jgi:ribosomal protein L7/L12
MPRLGICKCCGGRVSSEARLCPHCGQPDPYYDEWEDDEWSEVRIAIRRGDKIEAIKIVREKTGWGLKEAKDFVESL